MSLAYVGWQTPTCEYFEQTKTSLCWASVEPVQGTAEEIEIRRMRDLVKFETGVLPLDPLHALSSPVKRFGMKTRRLGSNLCNLLDIPLLQHEPIRR